MKTHLRRLLFFWLSSFSLAVGVYYLLWVMQHDSFHDTVFATFPRMIYFHSLHPIQFIAIPCFFYGILATLLSGVFRKRKLPGQLVLMAVILVATVLISSPFGGMLWEYYYMKAGYYSSDWTSTILDLGTEWGIENGWVIILFSFPYNIICSAGWFFLTKKGANLFRQPN